MSVVNHSSGEETLWHNKRTCPDGGLHCGIGSHCLTDSCRKNEEEEEEEEEFRCEDWTVSFMRSKGKKNALDKSYFKDECFPVAIIKALKVLCYFGAI